MRRALQVASCLVVAVLLAGCGGMQGTDTTDAPTNTTVVSTTVAETTTDTSSSGTTDSATTTDTPTTTAEASNESSLDGAPAGVQTNEITDAFALVDANDEALDGANYTRQSATTLTASNGTEIVGVNETRRLAANHTTFLVERSFDGTATVAGVEVTDVARWYNGTASTLRLSNANETTYTTIGASPRDTLSLGQELSRYYVDPGTVTTTETESGVELRLTPPSGEETVAGYVVDVTDRTVTVTMTDDGLVEQFRVEYTGTLVADADVTVQGVQTVDVTAVGETTVDRPAWVGSGGNATGTR